MPGPSKLLQPFFGVAKSEHSLLQLLFFACLTNRWELEAIFLLIFRCLPAHRNVGTGARGSSRCPVTVRSRKAPRPPEEFLASPLGNRAVLQNDQSRSRPFTLGLDPVQCPVLNTHCTLRTFHRDPAMEGVFQTQRVMRNFEADKSVT